VWCTKDSPDKFTAVENVPTKKSARTMALDLKTHSIFAAGGVLRGTGSGRGAAER